MGVSLLVAAQVGMAAVGTGIKLAANASAKRAADSAAAAQQAELQRQANEEGRIATEEKSDRAREADKEFASFLATSASQGGALGTVNAFRGAQEIGFIEGIDLARISANSRGRLGRISASSASVARGARRTAATSRINQFATLVAGGGAALSIKARANALETQKTLAEGRV